MLSPKREDGLFPGVGRSPAAADAATRVRRQDNVDVTGFNAQLNAYGNSLRVPTVDGVHDIAFPRRVDGDAVYGKRYHVLPAVKRNEVVHVQAATPSHHF
jgi:hypothetical protein